MFAACFGLLRCASFLHVTGAIRIALWGCTYLMESKPLPRDPTGTRQKSLMPLVYFPYTMFELHVHEPLHKCLGGFTVSHPCMRTRRTHDRRVTVSTVLLGGSESTMPHALRLVDIYVLSSAFKSGCPGFSYRQVRDRGSQRPCVPPAWSKGYVIVYGNG